MTRCTWTGCEAEGSYPQLDKAGRQWACLCLAHQTMLDDACGVDREGWSPARMVGAWIKAQGGAQAAAKRMTNP